MSNDNFNMKIRFWGVRGSIPSPLTKNQIQEKFIALIESIFKDPKKLPFSVPPKKEEILAYLDSLPPELSGTYGGETTCVEIQVPDSPLIILDAGSGARLLGQQLIKRLFSTGKLNPLNNSNEFTKEIHMFFSHYHWDHLQGFPFFTPAFLSGSNNLTIHFYGKEDHTAPITDILSGQQQYPNFPVEWESLPCIKIPHALPRLDPQIIKIGNASITYRELSHPDFVFAYSISHNNKKIVFATDYEHRDHTDPRLIDLSQNADVLYYDTQYTPEEYIGTKGSLTGTMPKFDWGHSTYEWAVKHALTANVKHLLLGHHEPLRDDFGIARIVELARNYSDELTKTKLFKGKKLKIDAAREGIEFSL